jgi:hypothetical protein
MFGGHQTEVRDQVPKMREATEVADLGDEPNRRDKRYPADRLQRLLATSPGAVPGSSALIPAVRGVSGERASDHNKQFYQASIGELRSLKLFVVDD